MEPRRAVLLLANPASYRISAFRKAAEAIGVRPILALNSPLPDPQPAPDRIHLDFTRSDLAITAVDNLRAEWDELQLLAIDDSAADIAAALHQHLGQTRNDPDSATAARNKIVMREHFERAGLPTPLWRTFDPAHPLERNDLPYPIVVKPSVLNGSRGVIRADDDDEFAVASTRLAAILTDEGLEPSQNALWETFIPGFEVAVEGLMTDGELTVLALFDKPDPLDGPFFEETIYVTPSRLPQSVQVDIARTTQRMANAVGFHHGPVHAELRINDKGVWLIEIAGRSIGGLCSSVLEFGIGMSLEEIVLRHAFGEDYVSGERSDRAVAAMMIPIPAGGMFRSVQGIEEALTVSGITGVDITARVNYPIQPLPEGASYLGFIFAQGSTPAEVESALRDAHSRLTFEITPMLRLVAGQ